MTEYLKPDICVIGAGSGGLGAAIAAAGLGASVVLVEKGRMGGDRLNAGGVPAMALLAAARRAHLARHAAAFGVPGEAGEVDFGRVRQHVRQVVDEVSVNDTEARLGALGVKVIREAARFADRRTVVAGDHAIRARRFVVATGSVPRVPPVPGLDGVAFLTSETVFDLPRRPRHLVVLGGDATAIELAQAFRRLGSAVTVIVAGRALGEFDREASATVLDALRAEGVAILEGADVTSVAGRAPTNVRIQIEVDGRGETIDGSHLLLCLGRSPNTEGLDLETAAIARGPDGIGVNGRLRTTNRLVHAIGDVVPGPRSAHRAEFHAGLVVRAILFRLSIDHRRRVLPSVAFCDPEIARVGLDETAARARFRTIRILRWPYSENDRARAEREIRGFVKLVTDRRGVILGVTLVGAAAGEQIALWTLVVSRAMTVADLADAAFPYPTFGEIGKRAAITYFASAARRPSARFLVRLLRLFG